jgi:hypothetical protein
MKSEQMGHLGIMMALQERLYRSLLMATPKAAALCVTELLFVLNGI